MKRELPGVTGSAGWYVLLWRMPTRPFQYADLRQFGPYTSKQDAVTYALDKRNDGKVQIRLLYAVRTPCSQLDWHAGERLDTAKISAR